MSTSSSRPTSTAGDPEIHDYAIIATSSRADDRTRVIKHGESFAVFDASGAIRRGGAGELGIYHDGTRFLSTFEVAIERRRMLLLGSTVRNDGVLVVHLASPDMPDFSGGALERDAIHVALTSFLWRGAWYVRLAVQSYARRAIELDLAMVFGADYADVFEVRGLRRAHRGTARAPIVDERHVTLGYDGLDHRARLTRLELAPAPLHLTGSRAEYRLSLAPDATSTIELSAAFGVDELPVLVEPRSALANLNAEIARHSERSATLATSNERFDAWLDRSTSDLHLMVTRTPQGPYPYAGVPWFSTPFGRDGIITAYERLWMQPDLASGVLRFLAAHQASAHDRERDAEPGKILHESRLGEMAALGEIPFGQYYGSVDATPLFVILAAAHWRRTADRGTTASLWPHVERALAWLDTDGDRDRDGFIEYPQRTAQGLISQGWKDSNDSVSHASGELAEGPIALCEVQGYAYAARRGGAELARVLGFVDEARRLETIAEELRVRFDAAFWSESLGTYALALDGAKRPCLVRSSNAGHLLWSGIVSPDRAARVADALFSPSTFTGWGIRTLDATAARFNPISYHNGSIWPHDNALIAAGLARYGLKSRCSSLLAALFDASHYFDLGRMPELFCGFARRESEGPTNYPVACAPQAWAAGAVFLLVQACLGISIDAQNRRVLLDRPHLPRSLSRVVIRDLQIADATVDLVCQRQGEDVGVHLERRTGDVEIALVK